MAYLENENVTTQKASNNFLKSICNLHYYFTFLFKNKTNILVFETLKLWNNSEEINTFRVTQSALQLLFFLFFTISFSSLLLN